MTRDKLLELYKCFKEKGIDFQDIKTCDIEYLSDKDIDIVLNSKYPDIILELLQNDYIKGFSNVIINKIINAINNSTGLIQAQYAYLVATTPNKAIRSFFVDFIEIIGKATGRKQAECAISAINDENILKSGKALDFANIISNSVGEIQAKFAFDFAVWASIPVLLNIDSALEYTETISKLPDKSLKYILFNGKNILNYLNPFRKIEYIERLCSIQTNEELEKLYNMTISKIKSSKKWGRNGLTDAGLVSQKGNNQLVECNFWDLFRENPDQAILLLNENIHENIELTPTEQNLDIVIRKRKK